MAWNPHDPRNYPPQPPQGPPQGPPGYGYGQYPQMPPQQALAPHPAHAARQPSKLRAIGGFVILMASIAITFVVLFAGPGDALNEWQAETLFNGYYYPKLTFALVFLVVMVVLMGPWLLIVRLVEGKKH